MMKNTYIIFVEANWYRDLAKLSSQSTAAELACLLGDAVELARATDAVPEADIALLAKAYRDWLSKPRGTWRSAQMGPSTSDSDCGSRGPFPPEITYLRMLAQRPRMPSADDPDLPLGEVVLLCSDTPEGKVCAELVRSILEAPTSGQPWGRFKLKPGPGPCVKGLRIGGDGRCTFVTKGIPNLMERLTSVATGTSGDLTINLSGAYTGAVPFVSLAAPFLSRWVDKQRTAARQVRMHYLSSAGDDIIELPVYPIGLDFQLWHRESALLKAAQSARGEVAAKYYNALDPRMRAVLDATKGQVTGLPLILRDRYERSLETDHLQTLGERVICHFLTDDNYRRQLTDLLKAIGTGIWIGDKLPMAADHAALHHHNLLEIAQVILTPLMDLETPAQLPFLTQQERFVLLAAVMLHDCGHSVDRLPVQGGGEVPLFRSEVRDYHSYLAYHRLTSPGAKDDLGWDTADPYRHLAAWLCVFHRKATGFLDDTGSVRVRGKTWIPYADQDIALWRWLGGDQVPRVPEGDPQPDFAKLVALLRLIDGCDNQRRRVGWQSRMSEHWIAEDRETWRIRLSHLMRLVKGTSKASTLLRDLAEEALDSEREAMVALPDEFWDFRVDFGIRLAAGQETGSMIPWLEAARALDEFLVRDRQRIHYLKHRAVRDISIQCTQNSRKAAFEITLIPERDPGAVKEGDILQIDSTEFATKYHDIVGDRTVRNWILAEISDEAPKEITAYLTSALGRKFDVSFQWEPEPATTAHGCSYEEDPYGNKPQRETHRRRRKWSSEHPSPRSVAKAAVRPLASVDPAVLDKEV